MWFTVQLCTIFEWHQEHILERTILSFFEYCFWFVGACSVSTQCPRKLTISLILSLLAALPGLETASRFVRNRYHARCDRNGRTTVSRTVNILEGGRTSSFCTRCTFGCSLILWRTISPACICENYAKIMCCVFGIYLQDAHGPPHPTARMLSSRAVGSEPGLAPWRP